MKKTLTTFCLFIIIMSANAQTYMWAKHIEQYFLAVVQVKSSAIDASNNIYVSGWFNDTVDFDPGPAVNNIVGNNGFFILKLDPNGDLGWVKTFDVNAQSGLVGGLDIDAAGNIYTSGQFYQTCDFNPGPGVANMTPTYYDTFILKLDAAGDYVWAKQIAGLGFGTATGYSLSVDPSGNVYAGGSINGTYDFDPNGGVANLGTPGNNHAWLLKWDTDGNYIWAKEMASDIFVSFTSISSGNLGDVFAAGQFSGTVDMDPGAGNAPFADTSAHVFVAHYDSSGNYLWANNYDGTPYGAFGNTIATDAANNVIATGNFEGTVDFDPTAGISNLTSTGGTDAYIVKYSSGGILDWTAGIGGVEDDFARDISVDGNGNIYTTGFNGMGNVDFDPGGGTQVLNSPFGAGYISALDGSGNYRWAAQNGGSSGLANCWLIRTDNLNNMISIGNFNLTVDFDPGPGIANLNNSAGSGPGQMYVQKLGALPNVGIEESNGNQVLKIFPNPTVDMIHIRCKDFASTLQIVDMNGEVVMTKKINIIDENNIAIDVTSLSNGIYFVYLDGNAAKFVKN